SNSLTRDHRQLRPPSRIPRTPVPLLHPPRLPESLRCKLYGLTCSPSANLATRFPNSKLVGQSWACQYGRWGTGQEDRSSLNIYLPKKGPRNAGLLGQGGGSPKHKV